MSTVLNHALRRSGLWFRRANPNGRSFEVAARHVRLYSGPLRPTKKPLLDKNSGTILGVTAGLLLGGFYVSQCVFLSLRARDVFPMVKRPNVSCEEYLPILEKLTGTAPLWRQV
ncbi:hypothetical protein R3P38DRAFT_162114 [Favolaschia claudopus]|uniref:Uncharacterized protein n=1 Tax=Favolaschia claudopus TaxID=2862362 RepID=A0AAW0CZJ7_9AGAR